MGEAGNIGGPSERTYNTGKLKEADAHTSESAWQPRKSWPGGPSSRREVRGCGVWGMGSRPGRKHFCLFELTENIFVCLN